MHEAASSIIDFDAMTGTNLFPLSGRVRCGRCGDRASVVVNGKLLCGACFFESAPVTTNPQNQETP